MYEKLTDVFKAVAIQNLKAVDVPRSGSTTKGSNQHEIGGLVKAGFAEFLGLPLNGEKRYFKSVLSYITDDSDEPVLIEDLVSWYDTRYNQPDRSSEYRLYYTDNDVTAQLQEGDFFLIALTLENTLLMVFAPRDSSAEKQLRSLFGAFGVGTNFSLTKVPFQQNEIVLPVRVMLAQLGLELDTGRSDDSDKLAAILEKFGGSFPKTRDFSSFARDCYSGVIDIIDFPDDALLSWMDEEENLFRLLERHIVAERLRQSFGKDGDDVDEFVKFSLSVQNRRKSRGGHAFENHIEEILTLNGVSFDRGAKTEGKRTPDFLFPGQVAYHDESFDESKLRMLGAKTTCKDRWRQVLAEAKRIERKHLITLQPAISEDQTSEMQNEYLQLVVPAPIQQTYSDNQREYLYSFKDFINEVR